eukprot:750128-Hanusia_phi.AAC.6
MAKRTFLLADRDFTGSLHGKCLPGRSWTGACPAGSYGCRPPTRNHLVCSDEKVQTLMFAGSTTVNKVCASGMKSISLASMGIMLGQCSAAVVGGFESMSNAPYLIEKARFGGYRYGDGKLVDSLIFDGLWDPYGDHHMGICAEKCAKDFSISREEMDEHVVESYKRAINAIEHRHFAEEIVPVST